jgi:hypothetical protein
MYIDLNLEVRTNAEFQHKLKALTDDVTRLEKLYGDDPKVNDKIGERIIDIYRLCKYNAGLLVPYFFPQYPYDKPLSCTARPYSYAMFHMQIGGSTTFRAGRQIGKSTSLSARQLIYSHVIPKHRSMYVVPHQSFLDTYSNRQREMERVFRFYQKHKEYRQNLKYKEYPNGSVTMLVKCLTDTQEARSKSAYELLYDESVHPNTIIPVCEGEEITLRHISSVLVGEKVLAYDSSGCIKPAYVRDNRNKGIKNVWKLKFSNGSELICTGNTRFWTSEGWMFLCEFLSWEEAARGNSTLKAKTLLAIREAANPGDSSWRRQHAMGREISRTCRIQPREGAGSLLQTQGASSSQLCEVSTENCAEWRLGRGELPICDSNYSSIQFYVCPGLSPGSYKYEEASQNSHTGMVRSTDVGGDCLVVSGRRDTDSSGRSPYQHPWVSSGAGRDVSAQAYTDGSNSESPASEKGGENLLYNSDRIRGNTQIHRESEAVCSRVYAVQSESAGSDIFEMPFLRDSISKEGRTSIGYACVRGLFVPEKSCRLENQEVCTEPWGKLSVVGEKNKAQIDAEPRIKKSFINKEQSIGRETKTRSPLCRKMESHSRRLEEAQCGKDKTTNNCKDGGSCLCGATKGESKIAGAGSYKESAETRATENAKRAETKIESVSLLSIEYAGKEEVWDIDVETHHTFFANGVAIHNCQLLDPDFIPDIEQCQKAYNTPITIYAGTSTTVDSLLETNYQDSSQACWLLRAPGYESKSAGKGWLNCGDQEDVMKAMSIRGIKNPATGKIIDVTDGHFVHQLQSKFEQGYLGFHIPQIIIPDYANRPQKWMEIWNAYERYDIKKFLQEILGIPTEEGMREISMNDLKRMCCLTDSQQSLKDMANSPHGRYKYVVSGCDWGGSDYNPASKTKVSYTVHVILGITWEGYVDILHIRQYSGMDYRSIANQICEDHAAYNAVGIASDFGVGAAYNMLLRENPKIKAERHFIFNYVGPQSSLIKAPANGGWFNQYSLNRTESITTLYDGIKKGRIRCYDWELAEERVLEFLNLYRMPVESPGGNATFKYQRHGSKADDTLHAVNFAYCLARIILQEPIVEDPTLRRTFQDTFNPQAPQFFNPHGHFDMGGVISG